MKTDTKYTDIKTAFHYIDYKGHEFYIPYTQISAYEIMPQPDRLTIFSKSNQAHTFYFDSESIKVIQEFKFWFKEYLKFHEN